MIIDGAADRDYRTVTPAGEVTDNPSSVVYSVLRQNKPRQTAQVRHYIDRTYQPRGPVRLLSRDQRMPCVQRGIAVVSAETPPPSFLSL